MARVLGAEDFGVYTYVIAVVTVLGIPAVMGLPNLVLREVAAYHANAHWSAMRGILKWANKWVLLISLGLMLATMLVAWTIREQLESGVLLIFGLAVVVLLPANALSALRTAALRGLHHVVLGQLPETIIRPSIFVVSLVVAYLWLGNTRIDSSFAMALHVMSAVVAFGIGTWLLLKYLPHPVRKVTPEYYSKVWMKSASAFLLIGGLRVLNNQLAMLMLGPLEGAEAVAFYRVAARGAELVAFILTAVNMTLAPIISSLYASNQMERLQRIVTLSARLILVVSLPIAIFLILKGEWVLSTIFGTEFGAGATALIILSIGQLASAVMGPVAYLLNMTTHEKETAKGVAFSAIMCVGLNVLLIPLWGLEGAAVATAVSLGVRNLLFVVWVRKKLNIHSTALGELTLFRSKR